MSAAIRVLMLNRNDAWSVPGGDTVQMERTKAGLEQLGVTVVTGASDQIHPFTEYDVVHIFNWQQLEPALSYPELLSTRRSGRRPAIVLSPIFWFHTGHWFDAAAVQRPFWKALSRGIGQVLARRLYEGWQAAKFRRGALGSRYRELLSVPNQVLPNSRVETAHLAHTFGLNGQFERRCMVVPNGIECERFDPLPLPDLNVRQMVGGRPFVLQVARIQAAKNQLGLIEALWDTPVPLVFAGQPSPYESEYINSCYEAGRSRGDTYFLGSLAPEALGGVYVQAAVHALPSWRETPGLVSLEAAAAGCRIVTTSVGSAAEYFGDLAWYCHPGDPASIRRAVTSALAASPSQELRQRVLECYTWKRAAEITLQSYHIALNHSSRSNHE